MYVADAIKPKAMNDATQQSMPRMPSSLDQIPTGELPIYYMKSNFFRVIHVDGMYGGGTPSAGVTGDIMMTVVSHRLPFPEMLVNDASGNEVVAKRKVKYGVENEFEAALVMNLGTAKMMVQWLQSNIKNVEDLMETVREQQATKP